MSNLNEGQSGSGSFGCLWYVLGVCIAGILAVVAYVGLTVSTYLSESSGVPEGYPTHFRYTVDLKVDGSPLTLSRVIKCTGEIFRGVGGPPNSRAFRNPPIIAAYIGDNQAVYAGVPNNCNWAAERPNGIDYTERKGAYVPVIIHAPDTTSFIGMEAYVSKRHLASDDSFIQFIDIKAERVGEDEFIKSEESAKGSPDLKSFAFTYFVCEAPKSAKRRASDYYGALVFPRETWAAYPEIVNWVESLPTGSGAYDLYDPGGKPEDPATVAARTAFLKKVYSIQTASSQRPPGRVAESVPLDTREWLSSYDRIHPAAIKEGMIEIDLRRTGRVWMYDRFLNPDIHRQKAKLGDARLTGQFLKASVSGSVIRIAANDGVYFVQPADSIVVIDHSIIQFSNQKPEPVEGVKDASYCS